MSVNNNLSAKRSGPLVVFYCYSSVPIPAFTFPILYNYVRSLVQTSISRFIVCADEKRDQSNVVNNCKLLSNCEVIFVPTHGYEFGVMNNLLWLIGQSPLSGTVVLVARGGQYKQTISLIQQLGWHVILAHPPGADRDLMAVCDELIVLPLHFEPPTHVMSIPTNVQSYMMTVEEEIDMSPLNWESIVRLIENFRKTTCTLKSWPFLEPYHPALLMAKNTNTNNWDRELIRSLEAFTLFETDQEERHQLEDVKVVRNPMEMMEAIGVTPIGEERRTSRNPPKSEKKKEQEQRNFDKGDHMEAKLQIDTKNRFHSLMSMEPGNFNKAMDTYSEEAPKPQKKNWFKKRSKQKNKVKLIRKNR